jgi:hypothetical protein
MNKNILFCFSLVFFFLFSNCNNKAIDRINVVKSLNYNLNLLVYNQNNQLLGTINKNKNAKFFFTTNENGFDNISILKISSDRNNITFYIEYNLCTPEMEKPIHVKYKALISNDLFDKINNKNDNNQYFKIYAYENK